MQKQTFSFAVGALLLSAGAVSAATLTDNLNLRSGPGLGFDVIGAMPAGSDVRVLSCGPSWCRVVWNDATGFASRRFISSGGPITAAASSTAIVAPGYDYGYAQTRSSSWAPNPGVGYGGWGYSRYYGYR